jgi:hypothetical protein
MILSFLYSRGKGEIEMAEKEIINKTDLLKELDNINFDREAYEKDSSFEQMSLAGSLLTLAHIDHESEYKLCQSIARYLLGEIPEPDDADLDN